MVVECILGFVSSGQGWQWAASSPRGRNSWASWDFKDQLAQLHLS